MSDDEEKLPPWVGKLIQSAQAVPGATERLVLWVPALSAAAKAGRRGLAVVDVMRHRAESGEALEFPDELLGELVATFGELAGALPALQEVVPTATNLIDLGAKRIDEERAQQVFMDTVEVAEVVGTRALAALVNAAFFAVEPVDTDRRTRNLGQLFERLETLFDRALQIWLFPDGEQGGLS